MGNSGSRPSEDEKALESRLEAVGDLPMLRLAFSRLSPASSDSRKPSINPSSLEGCLKVPATHWEPSLHLLASQVGSALADAIFRSNNEDLDWIGFLKGFERCCRQGLHPKLQLLFMFFWNLLKGAQLPLTFSIKSGNSDLLFENDFVGYINSRQLQDLLWICWYMMCQSKYEELRSAKGKPLKLPDIEPLIRSADIACSLEKRETTATTDLAVCSTDGKLSVEKLFSWMLTTIGGLSDCLCQYVRAMLANGVSSFQEQNLNQVSHGFQDRNQTEKDPPLSEVIKLPGLLRPGIAWAISLSQNDAFISSKLAMYSNVQDDNFVDLLYRSATHGMGMNRFWAQVEGYKGPVLMLISGSSREENGSQIPTSNGQGWIVGAFLKEGFENKDCYYGRSGSCLFALEPIFLPLRCTSRGYNYVYSHTSSRSTYRVQQRLNGIGFGGDYGKERLWLDEDFACLTVRHHVVDKTYGPGMLLPKQGFAPLRTMVLEVEVWGLGGEAAFNLQEAFRKREGLFSEQRRKVELKSFGNWVDSPEKMMMDMVSDPNKIGREER